MSDPFGIEKTINTAVDGIKSSLLHDVQVLVWRLTATNALRVLAELDADNAAKYMAAIEAMG